MVHDGRGNYMKTIRERKHRLPREAYQGEIEASITVCVADRLNLFVNPEVVAAFIEMLREVAARRSCVVPVYCFMPDHLHLVLQGTSPEADLWAAAKEFKQRSGYWLHEQKEGFCWQKDFHDHLLRPGEDLAAHVRYVADNPCRKGLAATWEEYPYTGSIGCILGDVLAELPSCRTCTP